jgi:hypothetical protein
LTRDELLGVAQGGAERGAHLDACAECRAEVEAIARMLVDVASVEVPEPSPLFWDHFSARVSDAVRAGAPSLASRDGGAWGAVWWLTWRGWRVMAPLSVAVVALVLTVVLLDRPPASVVRVAGGSGAATASPALVPGAGDLSATDDDAWVVFSTLAEEAGLPDTSELALAPGSTDGALLQLSDEERDELGRLLKVELDREQARVEG